MTAPRPPAVSPGELAALRAAAVEHVARFPAYVCEAELKALVDAVREGSSLWQNRVLVVAEYGTADEVSVELVRIELARACLGKFARAWTDGRFD